MYACMHVCMNVCMHVCMYVVCMWYVMGACNAMYAILCVRDACMCLTPWILMRISMYAMNACT